MSGPVYAVDRIEGRLAVLEGPDGRLEVELARLPDGIREGDCLRSVDGVWCPDPEETARRRSRSARRTAALTALAQKAERVLYLTGTPLENRVEEMCFLLSTLSPETAAKARELSDMAGALVL